MKEFVPDIILKNYSRNIYQGELNAVILILDLTGFTSITDYLMKQDKEGVEILNGILTDIFGTIINFIYSHNGFVSSFAGDSLTAIFPDPGKPEYPLNAAKKITEFINKHSIIHTKYGDLKISLTLGISQGDINWGIIGPEIKKTFFFKGDGLNQCYLAEDIAQKNQVVVNKRFHQQCAGMIKAEKIDQKFYLLSNFKLEKFNNLKLKKTTYLQEIFSVFFPENLPDLNYLGEFRNIASVFISFKDNYTFEQLDDLTTYIIKTAIEYGGFFNKILFYPRGGEILVIFGAPISYPNNPERAANFSLAVKENYPVNIGISYGLAYSGIVGNNLRCEYTALGNVVNLAHRIKKIAKLNDILISQNFYKLTKNKYSTELEVTTPIKGFKQLQSVYRLMYRTEKSFIQSRFKGGFFGRSEEINKITNLSNSVFNNKSGKIVYLFGKTGIGKSRLVHEFIHNLNQEVNFFIFPTDEILQQNMQPLIHFFKDYFKLQLTEQPSSAKKDFHQEFNRFTEKIKGLNISPADLKRIKSVICSLLNIKLEHSILDSIESNQRIKVINQSLKDFFILTSKLHPLVMLFEDIQWLDKETLNFIQTLTQNIQAHPLLVILTSRLNVDNSIPDLITEPEQSEVIELNKLELKSVEKKITDIFLNIPNQSTVDFIWEKSLGNPFFIEQYCLFLKENDHIEITKSQVSIKKNIQNIPNSINDLLISRIDRLSAELKETSQIASILGREFNLNLLYKLISKCQDNQNLTSIALSEQNFNDILSMGILENLWDKISDLNYIFNHVLFYEVIYGLQLKSRLRKMHNLAGTLLKQLYPDHPDHYAEIAYHFEKAEKKQRSLSYYLKASQHLKNQFYNYKALEYGLKALSLARELHGDESDLTNKINYLIGVIYNNLSEYQKSIDFLQKAENFFIKKPKLNKDNLTDIYLNLGVSFRCLGKYDQAMVIYNKAVSYAKNEDINIASIYDNIGVVLHEMGKYKESIQYSKKALKLFKNSSGINTTEAADTFNNLGVVYLDLGEYRKAYQSYKQALKIMEKLNQYRNPKIAHIYNNFSAYYYYIGDYEKSIKYSEKGLNVLLEVLGKNHADVAYLYNNLGAIYNEIYNFDKSIPYIYKALDIYKNIFSSSHSYLSPAYSNLGFAFMEKDDMEKSYYYCYKSLRIKINIYGKNHIESLFVYYNIAKLKTMTGRLDQALALVNWIYPKIVEFYGKNNTYSHILITQKSRIYLLKNKISQAESYLKESFNYFKQNYPQTISFAHTNELYGDICLKKGQLLETQNYYQSAREILKKKNIPHLINRLDEKINSIPRNNT